MEFDWKNDKYTLKINSFEVDKWNYIVSVFSSEPCSEIWENKKIQAYRYNISLDIGGSSIYLGYWHNTQVSNNMGLHSLKIEFNFSKARESPVFDWICSEVLYSSLDYIYVARVDMCLDLPVSMSSVIVDRKRKQNARSYNGTLYYGSRGSNGSIKIYDKGAEKKSKEVLSRYEVTIKPIDTKLTGRWFLEYSLVDINVISNWQMGFELDPLIKAGLLCVVNGDMDIKEFGRHQKKKIKDAMCEMTSFNIVDSPEQKQVINQAVKSEADILIKYINSIHQKSTQFNIGVDDNRLPF